MTATFIEHFADLKEPRDGKNKRHQLMDSVFLVIAGVIGGAKGWEAIETFGEGKLEGLQKYFPFANGEARASPSDPAQRGSGSPQKRGLTHP